VIVEGVDTCDWSSEALTCELVSANDCDWFRDESRGLPVQLPCLGFCMMIFAAIDNFGDRALFG